MSVCFLFHQISHPLAGSGNYSDLCASETLSLPAAQNPCNSHLIWLGSLSMKSTQMKDVWLLSSLGSAFSETGLFHLSQVVNSFYILLLLNTPISR